MSNAMPKVGRNLPDEGDQVAREIGRLMELVYKGVSVEEILLTRRKARAMMTDGSGKPFVVTVSNDV